MNMIWCKNRRWRKKNGGLIQRTRAARARREEEDEEDPCGTRIMLRMLTEAETTSLPRQQGPGRCRTGDVHLADSDVAAGRRYIIEVYMIEVFVV